MDWICDLRGLLARAGLRSLKAMSLDEDFPLGDGTADVEAVVTCPYCGEPGMLTLDPGSGDAQDYVEDCPVCCQPWQVFVRYSAGGVADVRVDRL